MANHDKDIPAEKLLFDAADQLRGSVESAEYKHLVLGLVFLKYVSDAFAAKREELQARFLDAGGDDYIEDAEDRAAALEDRDEYESENVFWVPKGSRWDAVLALGSQPQLGVELDRALDRIEQENDPLRGVLPRVYAKAPIPASKLGELVLTVAKIGSATTPSRRATSSAASTSTSSTQVTVGVLPIANVAPLYLGMEQGFFADEGIEIEPQVGQGGAELVTGLQAGESEFAFLGYTPSIVARAQGLPIKLVANADNGGTTLEDDWQVVTVGEGSQIREPEDLQGQTIAVNALRGVAEVAIKAGLDAEGVDPESVDFLEVPFPEMPAALEAGRVDAALLTEPFLTPVLNEGGRIVLAPYLSLGELFPNGTYATTEQVIAEDPEVVEGFERAITKSLQYATDNPEQAREIVTTFTEIPPEVAQEMRLPKWPTEIDTAQVEELIGYTEQFGIVDESVPIDELLWEGAATSE